MNWHLPTQVTRKKPDLSPTKLMGRLPSTSVFFGSGFQCLSIVEGGCCKHARPRCKAQMYLKRSPFTVLLWGLGDSFFCKDSLIITSEVSRCLFLCSAELCYVELNCLLFGFLYRAHPSPYLTLAQISPPLFQTPKTSPQFKGGRV